MLHHHDHPVKVQCTHSERRDHYFGADPNIHALVLRKCQSSSARPTSGGSAWLRALSSGRVLKSANTAMALASVGGSTSVSGGLLLLLLLLLRCSK